MKFQLNYYSNKNSTDVSLMKRLDCEIHPNGFANVRRIINIILPPH